MGAKSIRNNSEIAMSIKRRRNELNLTIEEAAAKAGVGAKTWSRYESGASIRRDKYRSVCHALNWRSIPGKEDSAGNNTLDLDKYKEHEAWSSYLAERFGKVAAVSFSVGSDCLLTNLQEDMEALSSMPRGTHIGELDLSWMESSLPSQFLMRYDYDFLYALRGATERLRSSARGGHQIIAHSVIEELALYLIVEEFRTFQECMEFDREHRDEEEYDDWDQWIFDIFDDMDIVFWLYERRYLTTEHAYHFDYWMENQFYCDN